jgi:hypothetical protein
MKQVTRHDSCHCLSEGIHLQFGSSRQWQVPAVHSKQSGKQQQKADHHVGTRDASTSPGVLPTGQLL